MKEVISVADEYLKKYNLTGMNALRILVLFVGTFLALFTRGKGQKAVLLTTLLAFFCTFLPEMMALCRTLIKNGK